MAALQAPPSLAPEAAAMLRAIAAVIDYGRAIGIDEVVEAAPVNRLQPPSPPARPSVPAAAGAVTGIGALAHGPVPGAAPLGADEARQDATRLLAAVHSLDDLRLALMRFAGSGLRETATQLVFADGNPRAPLMFVGEAPGGDEDREGVPFVGRAGQLLTRMIQAMGLDRARDTYITNVLPWRPPGNRKPAPSELAMFTPFLERHVALVRPRILVALGDTAAKSLLDPGLSITRARGRWTTFGPRTGDAGLQADPIAAIATFHPAFLLRTPAQKKQAWADLLAVRLRLDAGGGLP